MNKSKMNDVLNYICALLLSRAFREARSNARTADLILSNCRELMVLQKGQLHSRSNIVVKLT
jgi:hypothetical protein